MKKTKQKEAILATVCTLQNHPTADEVYEKLRKTFPRISLGTVYRNLNTFVASGNIRKVSIPGSSDRFDYRIDQHQHLYCDQCGNVFDIEAEVDIKLLDPERTFDHYLLILYGTCNNCLSKQTNV